MGNRCGSNALAMILRASGDRITEPEIAKAIFNNRVDATLSVDLLLYARARGFPADFERGSTNLILQSLTSGRPVILLLNLQAGAPVRLRKMSLWHYVVIYGYNRRKREFYLHSGVGEKVISFERLQPLWKSGGFWMMHLGVPVGPGGVAR